MHPLPFQIQTCYRMTIFMLSKLELMEMPEKMPEPGTSFVDMYRQIDESLSMLKNVKREDFEGKAEQEVRFAPGQREPWIFTGLSFVQDFVLPNYFFHAVTAYGEHSIFFSEYAGANLLFPDILRLNGVPIGKMDYIGKVGGEC